MKKLISIALLFLLVLSGCTENTTNDSFDEANSAEVVLETARIGAMTGSTGDMFVEKNYPNADLNRYDSIPDAIMALQSSKLDYVITSYTNALGFVRNNDDLEIVPGALQNEGAAIAVKKEEAVLLQDISNVLERFREDGTLDDIIKRWIKEDGSAYEQVDIPKNSDGGVLMVGVAANREPMCYIENEEIVGLDCELIERIAYELGMRVEYMDMQFSALIAALESGKVSVVISNVTATEERKLKVNFTEDYFQNPQVLVKLKTQSAEQAFRAEDFVGKSIAVWTGTIYDKMVDENIGEAIKLYFNSPTECVEATKNGKTYATILDEPIARNYAAKNPGITVIYPLVTKDEYGFVFNKDKDALREEFNEFLGAIKADGTYDELVNRWIDTAEPPKMEEFVLAGEKGTIRFATSGVDDPFSFVQDGKVAGFDVEIAYRFAQWAGYDIEVQIMDWGAMLPSTQSGKADFAGDLITITEERKEFVKFSDPHYIGGAAMVVFNEVSASGGSLSWWDSLKKSYTQNLIVENRWKMIVDGLRISLIITIFAFALATVLGFGVCGLRMSRNPILNAIGSIYINILRGTPIVVLLMITFYVIFAKSSISGTVVAIIAFGANGAAFIGEIIRSAILTVDSGQVEAARSMGFSKIGAFFTVTFPQAVRVAFPVYKSEFISMFKMTSVVGYIAITDLTKAGDIIRSRTYDAFFPLIVVALVYLVAASLMIFLFDQINRMTDKRVRRGK